MLANRKVSQFILSGVALAFAVLASTGPALAQETVLPDTEREIQASIEGIIEAAVRDQGARGASAAVLLPSGNVVTGVFGYADPKSGEQITERSRLLGGSTGKTFVATVAMMLVEEGVLDLDEPISKWLGTRSWFDRLPNGPSITLRMLLNHSSGLPDHIYQSSFQMSMVKNRFGNPAFVHTPEELVGFVLDLPPVGAPGGKHRYTDTGYIIVGLLIEAATGNSYYDELERRLLKPLSLDDVVPASGTRIAGLAPGFVRGGWANYFMGIAGKNLEDGELNLNPAIEWTGGGLATTPASLVRFYGALFGSDMLRPASLTAMKGSTAVDPANPAMPYGLGFFVLNNPEFGEYYHHSGWYPGYVSNVIWYDDLNIAVALQFNQDYNADIYEPVKNIARSVSEILSLSVKPADGN